jgi:hypothetical protein
MKRRKTLRFVCPALSALAAATSHGAVPALPPLPPEMRHAAPVTGGAKAARDSVNPFGLNWDAGLRMGDGERPARQMVAFQGEGDGTPDVTSGDGAQVDLDDHVDDDDVDRDRDTARLPEGADDDPRGLPGASSSPQVRRRRVSPTHSRVRPCRLRRRSG